MDNDLERLCGALTPWLADKLADPSVVIEDIRPLAGGLVNVIYFLTLSGGADTRPWRRRLVLRCDPITGPQAPYDMPGQFATYQAVARAGVPIPQALWLETDPRVLGRDFWVSEFVEAEAVGRLIYPDQPLAEERMAAYVDMLARIHEADWRGAGLDACVPVIGPGQIEDLIEAETGFLDGAPSREDRGLFEAARARLKRTAPQSFAPSLTHGDCSLSNYLFEGARIIAVVDWDLALITDRMRDVAFYGSLLFRFNPETPDAVKEDRRARFVDAYQARTGASAETLMFWEIYANYHNALSWTRPGWPTSSGGYEAYTARLRTLMER